MNNKKSKRILAWIGIIILVVLYLTTFILGVTGSPATKDLFMASLACTIVVPCLMYAMLLIAKILNRKDNDTK